MRKKLKNKKEVQALIERVAGEIVAAYAASEYLALIGIRSRGVPLAERIAKLLAATRKMTIDIGVLDITLYRDDVHTINQQPLVRETVIPFELHNRHVVLVDDVLFTGRTIRAALDALVDFGRPKSVALAVLIDRGGRELPIQPDFVGERIPVGVDKKIIVNLQELDGDDAVFVEGYGRRQTDTAR